MQTDYPYNGDRVICVSPTKGCLLFRTYTVKEIIRTDDPDNKALWVSIWNGFVTCYFTIQNFNTHFIIAERTHGQNQHQPA